MPTLGKTTNGAASSASSAAKTAASPHTVSGAGVVTAGHARIWVTASSSTTRAVIYADNGGLPGTRLAQSDEVVVTATSEAQVDYVFSGADRITLVDGQRYWVGVAWTDPGTDSVNISRDATASGRYETSAYAPTSFSAPAANAGPLDAWVDFSSSGTLGKTSDGSTSSASSTDKTAVSRHVASAAGTLETGHARLHVSSGSAQVVAVVYADSGGNPGALLAQSQPITVAQTAADWDVFTFVGSNRIALASGTAYWIGVSWQDPGAGTLSISRDNASGERTEAAGYIPSPFGAPTSLSGPIDAYIGYSTGSGGGTNPPGGGTGARLPANPGEALWIGAAAGKSHFNVGIGQGTSQGQNHTDFGQSQIEGGYEDPQKFFVNAAGNVEFRINASAGRTSANTQHPRSELRELKTDGTSKAAWDGNSGEHWMRGRSRITEVTTNRPWICFFQIHDADSDLARIQTEGTTGTSTGLSIVCRRTPPGGSEVRTVLRSGYDVGDWVDWEHRVDAGRMRVILDGATVLDVTGMGRTGCYFKMGCYLQDNLDKGAASGDWGGVEVERGSFVTWHTGYPSPSTPVYTGPVDPSGGTGDTQPPTIPGNVTAVEQGSDVLVTWSASTDNVAVDHYRVWRNSGAGFQVIGTATGLSYLDTGAGGSTPGRGLGPGGIAAPPAGPGVTLITSSSGSQLSITSSGIWDGGGFTRPRITIEADDVTVQNFVVTGGARDGISVRGKNVTVQNCSIYGITESTGDLNGITFFGDDFKMLYNEIGVDGLLLSGSRGGAHVDAVQTWNNDPGEQSARVQIIGNKIVGPASSNQAYISQGVMAQGKGATDGGGGGTGESFGWLICDNEFAHSSFNQIIKLDDVNDSDIARNIFSGASGRVVHDTSLSEGNTFWSSNQITGNYGQVGMSITQGDGPPNPYAATGGGGGAIAEYAVSAVDTSGNESPRSDQAPAVPDDTTPPSTPTGLAGTPGDRRAALSWTPASDDVAVVGYRIYRDGTPVGEATLTSYVDIDLTNGTSYSYRVTAFDAAGNESSQSSAVSVTPEIVPIGGVPYLPAELGPAAAIAVEAAWGADLSALQDTWAWSDITTDVRTADGISIQMGRADEASTSQPAQLALTLDSPVGRYALGGQSPHWPYVRRGTPIRVRIDPADGAGGRTVFLGFADGWQPGWDSLRGDTGTVALSASGVLRRLQQGSSPVMSAYRRAMIAQDSVVAYWPMEEGPASRYAPAVRGGSDMTILGQPDWGADASFFCSRPLPQMRDAVMDADVSPYTETGQIQVRFLLHLPALGEVPHGAILAWITTTGTVARWDITFSGVGRTDPTIGVYRYSASGGGLGSSHFGMPTIMGQSCLLTLGLRQSGADVDWEIGTLVPGESSAGFGGDVLTGRTVGRVTHIQLATGRDLGSTAIGHLTVENAVTSIFTARKQLEAFQGERASGATSGRLERLAREHRLPLERHTGIEGFVGDFLGPFDEMGPQLSAPLLDLLRECESADGGQLWDGAHQGASYSTRRAREDGVLRLTVPATQLTGLEPVDDDQRTRNLVEVQVTHGVTVRWEDRDGPLGTDTIGIYDESVSLNLGAASSPLQHAQWRVSLGTAQGYRYPRVRIDLRAAPSLAAEVLDVRPGYRVRITGLGATLTGMLGSTLDLIVEGISHEISPTTWVVELTCSRWGPIAVGTVAAASGDTSERVMRVDTDGSVLVAARPQGATSLQVSTTAGAIWTTDSDDYPLVLDVGGIPVRVTACSGGSSPQTMTCDPLSTARPAGVAISLWEPRVVGMG